ncbi:MAG: hypothetical protein IKG53_05260 [Solobacterium sp.]|nr:hypothetical protein [Solobacterium sp.]
MANYIVIFSIIMEVAAYAMIDPFSTNSQWRSSSEETITNLKKMRKIGIVLGVVMLVPLFIGLKMFYG